MVDWGGPFADCQADHFPDIPPSALCLSQGTLALDLLLLQEGSAYLTRQLAGPGLAQGRLHEVVDAPVMERWAYAVYPPKTAQLPGLREMLAEGAGAAPG